ncbi:MAG TPA: glutamine amidotransferase [Chloroflexota bacterium]|nr:glutamine amidotransferase [Chloroflexota bacterium]
MRLAICHLYASGMNVYGDRGNVTVLAQRCHWRGIDVRVEERGVGESGRLTDYDLIVAGGGQDRDQVAVSQDLQGPAGEELRAAIEDGAVLLAICGTYQLLGRHFKTGSGAVLPGIGVLDAWTEAGPRRFIGDAVVETTLLDPEGRPITLVGFENHSGQTFLGPGCQPLGTALVGAGNNGDDGREGAMYRNTFGTYLHGPLLPKNPAFADEMIRRAIVRRHGAEAASALAPLDDTLEATAHRRIVERIQRRGRVKSGAT